MNVKAFIRNPVAAALLGAATIALPVGTLLAYGSVRSAESSAAIEVT